jgi:hypothetical protein
MMQNIFFVTKIYSSYLLALSSTVVHTLRLKLGRRSTPEGGGKVTPGATIGIFENHSDEMSMACFLITMVNRLSLLN